VSTEHVLEPADTPALVAHLGTVVRSMAGVDRRLRIVGQDVKKQAAHALEWGLRGGEVHA
jgi:hypothetical protein